MFKAQAYAAEIASRREQQAGRINLAALHDWLGEEHGYDGGLKSVQRYLARTYPTLQVRASPPAGGNAAGRPGSGGLGALLGG